MSTAEHLHINQDRPLSQMLFDGLSDHLPQTEFEFHMISDEDI